MNWHFFALPLRFFALLRFCRHNHADEVLAFSRLKIRGRGNTVHAEGLSVSAASHCIFRITGDNNTVELGDLGVHGILKISICGSGNHVVIRSGSQIVAKLQIDIWQECRDGAVDIGRDCSFWEVTIRNTDSGSSVTIGDDCIFSKQVVISNTDEHAILSQGKVINRADALTVGSHVWIGQGVSLMKNCAVPDGGIVARAALVTHRFEEPGCILAGIPAKVVKRDIAWLENSVNSMCD